MFHLEVFYKLVSKFHAFCRGFTHGPLLKGGPRMGGAPPPPPGAPKLSVFCIEIPYINFVLKFPIKRKRDLGSTLCEKRDLALGNGNTSPLFGHVPF